MYVEDRKTELRNPSSVNIDAISTMDMLRVINEEDKKVAYAVERELPNIAQAVDGIYARLKCGGRLFYAGAGTSGRIGVLDASECPPTFSVPSSLVQGIIAGGDTAVFKAVEGAEDSMTGCRDELMKRGFNANDALVGIAASGTTPFVLGGLEYANSIGALTVGLSCNDHSKVSHSAQIAIEPIVGAEVITGSTRMKAGTAEKMVLNMISTGVMVKIGKVYGNLMVDLQVSNKKLAARAVRIVSEAADVNQEQAKDALDDCSGEVKTAIMKLVTGLDREEVRHILYQNDGNMSKALNTMGK